jgi:RNA polymerase sigma factor (sigma-70 family)
MTALPDWDVVSDAELACAAAAGDRRAFAGIYDRYADRLHDFCVGMLRDRDAAADCVQDVFCKAATTLPQLREPDKLRPWLYAIARNEALRCIRDRRREQVSDVLPEAVSSDPGPDTLAARAELADLIGEAGGGLSDRDRSVLELAYRHGLDLSEVAQALDVSYASAKKMVQRLREAIERSLGALLLARRGQTTSNACPELAQILDGWDGQFNILIRKRIARHAETCATCEHTRSELVNPVALLGAVPVFIPAPGLLRDHTLSRVDLTSASTNLAGADVGPHAATTQARPTSPSDSTEKLRSEASAPHHAFGSDDAADDAEAAAHLRRRLMLLVGLLAGIPLLALGLTIAFLNIQNTPVTPINVTATAPQPTNPAPAGTPTPASPPPPPPALITVTQAPVVPVTPIKPPPPPPPAEQTSPVTSAVAPPPRPPHYPSRHWPPRHWSPPDNDQPTSTQATPSPPPPPPPPNPQPPVIP